MRVGLIGDLHGHAAPALEWIDHVQPDFCLQAGDYWCYEVEWPVPVYWICGNHEHPVTMGRIIHGQFEFHENNRWLMGGLEDVMGVRVMALPGLPQMRSGPGPAKYPPKVYELCMTRVGEPVDVLLSHGCGFPFGSWGYDGKRMKSVFINFEEAGITSLIRAVRPAHAVSGHNHRFAEEMHEGIHCLRLGHRPSTMFHMLEFEVSDDTGGDDTEAAGGDTEDL